MPALVHCHPEQPMLQMLLALELFFVLVQLQKHGLHHIFRLSVVVQGMERHPEDGIAVGPGCLAERLVGQSGSPPCRSVFERPFTK